MKKCLTLQSLQAFLKKGGILVSIVVISTSIFANGGSNSDTNSGNLLAVVAAVNELQAAVTARIDALAETLTRLYANASDNELTALAQQPNLATLDPKNAFQFTDSATTSPSNIISTYNFIDNMTEKSAAQKILYSLNNMSDDDAKEARRVLVKSIGTSSSAISPMDATNAQILLNTDAYSTADQNNAERTVAFISDYTNPLGNIDLAKLAKEPNLNDGAAGLEYRVKVLTLASIRSLLLSNLYKSMNARIPIKELGTQIGIPNKPDASLTQTLQYIASRRISNPKWYNTINTAPPPIVNREVAYILAEMQWQLYLLHRDNERMLQTITATGAINLRSAKMLPDPRELELEGTVNGTAAKPPSEDSSIPAFTPTTSQ